jgi:hypothetical protein
LNKFKVSITYFGSYLEENIEIEAERSELARQKCQDIVDKNHIFLESAAQKNVFISKRIKDCRLQSIDWREELCENIEFLKPKNN